MPYRTIKQPDGLFCLFDTTGQKILIYDATPEDVAEEYAEVAAEDARLLAIRRCAKLTAEFFEPTPLRRALDADECAEDGDDERLEPGAPEPEALIDADFEAWRKRMEEAIERYDPDAG